MFYAVKEFVYRHKRKFIVTGLVIGGVALGFRYAQHKLIQWQEKEALDFLGQLQHQNHFESTEKTCNKTIMSLAPTLYEKILSVVDIDGHVQKLKDGVTDKIAIWEELKILSFTKVALMLYCGSMLTITLRIQLNIMGGYLFQDSTGLKEGNKSNLNTEVQQKYLSLCQYFLDTGVKELCGIIEAKVRFVLEGTSLKQNMSLQDIEHVFWAIQSSVSNDCQDPIKNFTKYMLPPNVENKSKEEVFRVVVTDTIELLQSEEITSLASSCISQGFSNIIDQIAENFAGQEAVSIPNKCTLKEGIGFVHPSKVAIPMAKLIPIISSIMNKQKGARNSEVWITPFVQMDKIKTLGANIYEAFSNPNPLCR